MADTNNTTQRYFLDLGGLTSLWSKIKSTFADKEETLTSIGNINISLGDLDKRITNVDTDVTNLEVTMLTFAPKEVTYYADAVEASKTLAVGTIINVLSDKTSAEDETPSGYSTGLYVVTGPGEIKFISTSDGNAGDSGITAIGERLTRLESEAVKSAQIVDETGKQLGKGYDVVNNVLLVSHDDNFDAASTSVNALTHRAVAKVITDINEKVGKIPLFKIIVVDALPELRDASISTVYLLRNSAGNNNGSTSNVNNLFTEYICVEETVSDGVERKWEKLGEQTLNIGNFVTKDELQNELNLTLASYAKKTDVESAIATAKQDVTLDILNTVSQTYATIETVDALAEEIESITGEIGKLDETYLTKNDAAITYLSKVDAADTYLTKTDADNKGWMTEAEIIISVQTGNIGEAIHITEEQINDVVSGKIATN